MKDKVLITGVTGFVGQNLSVYLSKDFNVIGISRQHYTLSLSYNSYFIDKQEAVAMVHLAGKAHDIKSTSKPHEYYEVNTELTKIVFDAFLASDAKLFIFLSTVKAVADEVKDELTEQQHPHPVTHYGKSKLLAEEYILSKEIPKDKRVYILRPCMIHGPGNKGNLNLLYKIVSKNIPWPLGDFDNKRSYCSIDNLLFIIKELIVREEIPSGIYNIADEEPISTNELISLIAESQNRKPNVWVLPKGFIKILARFGDKFYLPLNSERLQKLTDSYVVSNQKIKNALKIEKFPVSARNGLLKTIKSFVK